LARAQVAAAGPPAPACGEVGEFIIDGAQGPEALELAKQVSRARRGELGDYLEHPWFEQDGCVGRVA